MTDCIEDVAGQHSTLIDLLRWRASRQPGDLAYIFLEDGEDAEVQLTYGELERRARAIGATLLCLGAERAVLLYPPGIEYIAALFGCLYAGVTAVPAYPPDPARLSRSLPRLLAIVNDAAPQLVLTTEPIRAAAGALGEGEAAFEGVRWVSTDAIPRGAEDAWTAPSATRETLALLQYTSGSTAAPKGVMLTHGNLLHNLAAIERAFGHTRDSRGVIWLPPYHDMGLIGGLLQPLYAGFPVTLLSPIDFLQRPLRWLRAISRHRATTSGGPNFAYDLCVRKISKEERAKLDLSSWQVAFTGAEPVRVETLERFVEAFAPCGFRREALYPCYGLAEATLLVSGGNKAALPVVRTSDGARALVGCGHAMGGQEIVIANPTERRRCAPGEIGEIWVRGPNVARGYWGRLEETQSTFGARLADSDTGPFLRTGDLGFFERDELFVAARLKDLIIIRGRNHYPQDIELTVERCHPALRPGCTAAFTIDVDGQEELVVVQEVRPDAGEGLATVAAVIRRAVAEEHELRAHRVALIAPGMLPKTSSGKVQRRACREQLLADALPVLAQSVLDAAPEDRRAAAPIGEALLSAAPEARQAIVEQRLVEEAARVLRLDRGAVDPRTSLTALGIDSLAAIELQHRLEADFNASVPLTSILGGASVHSLAGKVLDAALSSAGAEAAPGPAPTPRSAQDAPLSYAERALWLAFQIAPESPAYNVHVALDSPRPFDPPRLARALDALATRHPILRANYVNVGGQPVRRIRPDLAIPLEVVDCAGWSREALLARIADEADRPFDLARGPVLRAALFSRSAEEHVLALTAHHIAVDLWSMDILFDDLGALYAAYQDASAMAAPAVRYADHVAWQEARIAGPEGERLGAYWRERLAGAPAALDLPVDRPRPKVQPHAGATCAIGLGETLTRELRALARAEGTTLYTVVLAAFEVLLHRYTGAEDLVVGSPVAGRTHAPLEGVVGCFVNHLVLRADLSRNPGYRRLLAEVRRTVLEALEHQAYPFPRLVEDLRPARDPGASLLFQVAFVWGKLRRGAERSAGVFSALSPYGRAKARFGGLEVEPLFAGQRGAAFDLTLTIFEDADALTASFQYSTALFEPATVAAMAEQLRTLLEGIVADPSRSIADFPLVTEAERQRLIARPQDGGELGAARCIHELFEEQARLRPDQPAVCFEDEALTFGELNARSNQIARALRALGVEPSHPVALMFETGTDLIAHLFGALKAGGALLCLDPNYPEARLALILEEVAPSVLLIEARCLRRHAALIDRIQQSVGCRVLVVQEAWLDAHDTTNLCAPVSPTSPAYVVFTSGSSGKPKGIIQSHRSFCQFIAWQSARFDIVPPHRVASWASITYDASYCEIFGALCFGATLCMAEPSVKYDPARLVAWAKRERISLLQVVPSFFRQVLQTIEASGGDEGHPLPHLERVLLAGEVVPIDVARAWMQRFANGPRLFNLYGPTECVLATSRTIEASDLERRSIPVGQAIDGRQILILSASNQPCPTGVPGEIYVRSAYLTMGYWRAPDETRRAFLQNPLHDVYPDPVYRTRDLGRRLPSGDVEFLGRIDNQVKIRGMRIELDEIASVLSQHARVRACTVVNVVPREGGEQRLCAYVVLAGAAEPAELREFLRRSLPEHMVPSYFVPLDELPRTPNGKLDRRALPTPSLQEQPRGAATEAPRTALQAAIAGIWAEQLGREGVGIHDSFFDLGGHSLLATQIINGIRERFAVDLSLRAFLEAPTVARLAEQVEAALAGSKAQDSPIPRVPRDTAVFPLSLAQQRLWIPYQLEPESTAYTMLYAVRLLGPLEVTLLQRAVDEIVRRHEILRTTIAVVDGQPAQIIAPPGPRPIEQIDLGAMPLREAEAHVQELLDARARLRFDLERGPLLQISLIRLGENSHVLAMAQHHICSDGWSMAVFVQELTALYAAFGAGEPSPLRELPIQYVDYALWHRRWLEDGGREQRLLSYWKERLAGAPTLRMPTDRHRPALQTFRGAHREFALPGPLCAELAALSAREGVTLYMTLVAGFMVLLHRYTGQDDIVIGTDASGRTRRETEGLIGFFANQLVLRTDMRENPTFRQVLQRTQEVVLGAFEHQEAPFDRVVAAVNPERDLGRTPLFQVKLGFMKMTIVPERLAGIEIRPWPLEGTSKFDLELSLWERADQVAGHFEYNTDLFDAATIEGLSRRLLTLLAQTARAPEMCVLDIPLDEGGATTAAAFRPESVEDFDFDA
jgi:amino acid adenylation domain-containing protein